MTYRMNRQSTGWPDVEDDPDALGRSYFGLLEGIEIESKTGMEPTQGEKCTERKKLY